MTNHKKAFAILALSLLFACGSEIPDSQSPGHEFNQKIVATKDQGAIAPEVMNKKKIPNPCGEGGVQINDLVAVTGNFDLRSEASVSSDKVKNEKASKILGKDQFHRIDNSTTVRRLCVQSEWTEVRIVTPDWLTHVRGWVPNEALREIERTKHSVRVYVEADFYWDKDTSRYKDEIVAVVNKIANDNKRCKPIDTSSVAKSSSRSREGDPVFFVTCGSGSGVFNDWFRPTDAGNNVQFAAKEPLPKNLAAEVCENAAKTAAIHPSTVEFSRLWDFAYLPYPSGRARVISSFKAKNSLNLELKFRIDCLFDGNRLIETNIAEKFE